jgi:hypothetical protein
MPSEKMRVNSLLQFGVRKSFTYTRIFLLFETLVGSETWAMMEKWRKMMESAYMRFFRSLLGVAIFFFFLVAPTLGSLLPLLEHRGSR